MSDEIDSLNLKLEEVKSSHKLFYEEESFRENDKKVLLFTGLPSFTLFSGLLLYLSPFLPPRRKFSKFQVLLLTFMRLRLNVSTSCLAYLFNMSQPSASNIIREVVDIMHVRLKPYVKWPERQYLQQTMPMQFRRHFGKKCVVIIDCFEVFTDRSSNLLARAQTWSQYKHHNTAKFLIGITPQGMNKIIYLYFNFMVKKARPRVYSWR